MLTASVVKRRQARRCSAVDRNPAYIEPRLEDDATKAGTNHRNQRSGRFWPAELILETGYQVHGLIRSGPPV